MKHYPHVTLNTDILHKNTAMSFLKYYTKYNYCVLYGNLSEFSNKYNMEKLSSHGYKVSMLKDLEDNIIYNHHISIEYFNSAQPPKIKYSNILEKPILLKGKVRVADTNDILPRKWKIIE